MDGNCFFVALCFTSGIPVRPQYLREQIVAYMKHMKDVFLQSFDQSFAISNRTWFIWEKMGRMGWLLSPMCGPPPSTQNQDHLCRSRASDVWGDDLYLALLLGITSKQPPVWCSSKTAKGKRFIVYSGLFVGYVLNLNLGMKRILGSRVPQARIKFKHDEDRVWQWESREA